LKLRDLRFELTAAPGLSDRFLEINVNGFDAGGCLLSGSATQRPESGPINVPADSQLAITDLVIETTSPGPDAADLLFGFRPTNS
jgi:hypothetical protein